MRHREAPGVQDLVRGDHLLFREVQALHHLLADDLGHRRAEEGAQLLAERVLLGAEAQVHVITPSAQTISNRPAAPWPPPMHMVTTAYLTPRRLPSMSAWPVMRAPDMP